MAGKKGHRGWGHIRRLPNKSKRFQASYIGPDLVRHYAARTFTAKMDAEHWLADERRSIELDTWTPPTVRAAQKRVAGVAVADYAKTWIAQRTLKPRTRAGYEDLLRLHIEPALGPLPVRHLTPEAVRVWWASLDTGHPTTNAHAYRLLRAVATTAVTDGLLASNPCHIERAGSPVRRRQPVILDVKEVAALAATIEPSRLKTLVLLAAWCGPRWGEVCELRRKDVGPGCETLTVARAVTHRSGECIVATPKSGKPRVVVVPPHIRADLKHHLDTEVPKDPESLLFWPEKKGCHIRDSVFGDYFKAALKTIGREGVRVHDLRHFAGTQTARVGNLVETMGRLGHSSVRASLIYQGVVSGRDAEVAEALSRLAQG